MSNWQDFTVVFYALALAVLGNALLWFVASAFMRLYERLAPRLADGDGHAEPPSPSRSPGLSPGKRWVALGSR